MSETEPLQKIWHRTRDAAMRYHEYVVPFLLGPWVPDLLRAVEPKPGERVLDLACGTGVVSRMAAERVGAAGRVTGVDLNPEMLHVAGVVSGDCPSRILWIVGDATRLAFPDASFDVVLCQQGLQFFPDRPAALREIDRALAPGGRAALAVWGTIERNPYFLALARAAARHLGEDVGEQLRSSFALGDADRLKELFAEAGPDSVEVTTLARRLSLPSMDDYVSKHLSGTSLATVVASLDASALSGLVSEVDKEMKRYGTLTGLEVPAEVHIAVMRPPARRALSRG